MPPWVETVGFLVGLVGSVAGLVGFVLHFTGRRQKDLAYAVQGIGVIDESMSSFGDLQVTFNGQSVERVAVSRVLFWHRGEETIHGSDVPDSDPLRIIIGGDARVLSSRILAVSRSVVAPQVATVGETDRVGLDFEFLDRDDGFTVEIVHTGLNPLDLDVTGTIMGLRHGIREVEDNMLFGDFEMLYGREDFTKARRASLMLGVFGSMLVTLGVLVAVRLDWGTAAKVFSSASLVLLGLLCIATGIGGMSGCPMHLFEERNE